MTHCKTCGTEIVKFEGKWWHVWRDENGIKVVLDKENERSAGKCDSCMQIIYLTCSNPEKK